MDAAAPRRHSSWFTRPGRIVLLATLIGAAPFLVFGAVQLARTSAWVGQRTEVSGIVRETVRDTREERFYVVVDFTARDGQEVAFGRWVDGAGEYRDGEAVRILYLPARPEVSARVVTRRGLWFEPLLLLALGTLPIVAGIVVFVVTERRPVQEAACRLGDTPASTPSRRDAGT